MLNEVPKILPMHEDPNIISWNFRSEKNVWRRRFSSHIRPLPDHAPCASMPASVHRWWTRRCAGTPTRRAHAHSVEGDEIHHRTGDVLLMVTVGDPGWAGCVRDAVPPMWASFSDPLPPLLLCSRRLFRRVCIAACVCNRRVSTRILRKETSWRFSDFSVTLD